MSLEQLTRNAIRSRKLDAESARRIRRYLDRGPYLTPDQYEALRSLGRALRAGEVSLGDSAGFVQE